MWALAQNKRINRHADGKLEQCFFNTVLSLSKQNLVCGLWLLFEVDFFLMSKVKTNSFTATLQLLNYSSLYIFFYFYDLSSVKGSCTSIFVIFKIQTKETFCCMVYSFCPLVICKPLTFVSPWPCTVILFVIQMTLLTVCTIFVKVDWKMPLWSWGID